MVSGGLKKVRPEIQVHFSSPVEKKKLEYKDKFPKDMKTLKQVKEKYGKVVWCKFTKCKFNEQIKGLQRITGTLLKNRAYTPINEQEHIWDSICTRDEIAIKYDEVITASGSKFKVPSCFSAVTGVSGRMDWAKLLQPDGSPIGGNIDSQHVSDAGYGGLDSNSMYGR
jgi:hypothetical protein